jgi:phage terminase large subunit-like protein
VTEYLADQYIGDVLSGKQVACEWVRKACERHVRDLETGHERGLWFDEEAAGIAIDFFSLLKHSKGEWAGQTIHLEPWQQFHLGELFGWKRDDGTRRFRTCYLEVGRKNGKSTEMAGVGLFMMLADNEPGAEIYTAATKRDQARIAHSEATRMVKSSPHLRKVIRVVRDNLNIPDTASKFEPVGRDADSLDGLNVHGALLDELHAHKTRDMYDIMETATGSRRQPLMFSITTAGFDRKSICYEVHEYTQKVLDGIIQDDSFFGIIYALDDEAEWEDERQWVKANPNLGVSVKLDDLRRKAAKAKEMPSALNAFLRLHMNQWTQAETRWINPEKWAACGQSVDEVGLQGRICYGGLDLSSTTDITALVLVFPPETAEDPYQVLCRFWIPEDSMHERSRKDRVPYDAWVRQGYITATPGNVVDYDWIFEQADEDMRRYDFREIAFDRWGAARVSQVLEEQGMEMVQFGQGFASMNPPMKELDKLILQGKLAHGGNPVLSWMAHNMVAREDPAGNLKPDKEKSTEKIDGMVALLMALDRATRHGNAGSVYEERDVLVL